MTQMTEMDVEAIRDEARAAWSKASPRSREVAFIWKGRRFTSRLTTFRTVVLDAEGNTVAAYMH